MGIKSGTILVVDDNPGIRKTLQLILSQYFESVETISSPVELHSTLMTLKPDVVLLDMNFRSPINNGNEGLYWLKEIKNLDSRIEVILITAYGDIQLAVDGMKAGAFDFVVKPWDNDNLITTLNEAIVKARGIKTITTDDSQIYWGNNPHMVELRKQLARVAATDIAVLISGENGVGKDLMASEIHRLSNRKDAPFIAVDMGAIPSELFESELFGHVKGSFTGAFTEKKGKFELAQGGTLFLDEIGNLPMHQQAKLLRALQNLKITKIGATKETPIDVRVICATNSNIKELIDKGEFREDLYYRISGFNIRVPALRERKEDILPLATYFLGVFNKRYKKDKTGFDIAATEYLHNSQWYGNIRELKSMIEKSIVISDGPVITLADLTAGVENDAPMFKAFDEKTAISEVLNKTGRNISLSARILNMSRPTLYAKIKKYNL